MPKLAAKDRKKVEGAQATSGSFEPLSPGKYVATLAGVEAKSSAAGNPMWVAEFEEIHDLKGDKKPGRQWVNMMLPTTDTPPEGYDKTPEKWEQYQALCAGRIKAFFEAFGYSADSDTDEMIGEKCLIQIGIRTIQKGERAGDKTNEVRAVLPLGDHADVAASVGGGGSEDEF